MTDGQLAWKATKASLVGCGVLLLIVAIISGASILALAFLGKVGAALLYAAMLFAIFWICAALDVYHKEERDAAKEAAAHPDDCVCKACTPEAAA